jgi:hypothetical protein
MTRSWPAGNTMQAFMYLTSQMRTFTKPHTSKTLSSQQQSFIIIPYAHCIPQTEHSAINLFFIIHSSGD